MIIEKKFLSKLKEFGLNSYESKVWVALLSRGVSTAGELSDIANVPRSRSYDVLESLEKKGFVVMKLGKPIKYIAVPPNEVVERVKKQIKRQAEEEQSILEEIRESEVLQELVMLHNNGIEAQDPSDMTGSIKGRENIYTHLEYQLKQANEEVVFTTTDAGLMRKSKALQRQLKKAKDRGVKITIAAPYTDKSSEARETLSNYSEVKKSLSESRFCIVDKKHVTLMLNSDDEVHPSYDVAIWMQSPYFAKTLLSSLK